MYLYDQHVLVQPRTGTGPVPDMSNLVKKMKPSLDKMKRTLSASNI